MEHMKYKEKIIDNQLTTSLREAAGPFKLTVDNIGGKGSVWLTLGGQSASVMDNFPRSFITAANLKFESYTENGAKPDVMEICMQRAFMPRIIGPDVCAAHMGCRLQNQRGTERIDLP